VHTRPREGNGSSCAGCHGSRPRDTSQFPECSAQSGHWFGGWYLEDRLTEMLRSLRKAFHTCKMNLGQWSETIAEYMVKQGLGCFQDCGETFEGN